MSIYAQLFINGVNQNKINKSLLEGEWPAYWITVPNEPANLSGVYHFRKTLYLESIPKNYIIHISADNKYKLFVNGFLVSIGPAGCDLNNWNFDTVDLKPYLKTGKNVIASVVWNYAEWMPTSLISSGKTGFIIQGNDSIEQQINTGKEWKCIRNKAYSFNIDGVIVGYYAAGPSERVNFNLYPNGWESIDFDDSSWEYAKLEEHAAIKGTRNYPGRPLVPSPIPSMELKKERFKKIRKSEGINVNSIFLEGKKSIVIPPHSSIELLLDNIELTTGYFSLIYSGGYNANLKISYAESLYYPIKTPITLDFEKGNRNTIDNKKFYGFEDKLIADGGKNRCYTSLWWRTWRYVKLQIETSDEALSLHDVYGTFTAYPFHKLSTFSANGKNDLEKMLEIGWRTARLCAHDTYMDCPYYEQLQYFGDTKIQTMITMYNTADTCMVKQAIEHGKRSLTSEGLTMSRFPSNSTQYIPPYSLDWIGMVYNYWMYRGDDQYVKSLIPTIRIIISWYEQWLKKDYSLKNIPYWFFIDWAVGFEEGEAPKEKDGNSALQDLVFMLTLEKASIIEKHLGSNTLASQYNQIIYNMRQGFKSKYWDEQKGLFADTKDKRSFSQHTNTLAILADIVIGNKAKEIFKQTISDNSIIQASLYFRHYINMAMDKVGLGDLLLSSLDIWKKQMSLGLTTWAETSEPSRSDCHAWGASLNIDFFSILLGIKSDMPGFKKTTIAPCLGTLKKVQGSIPHPNGCISVSYKVDKELKAIISLPEGVSGKFVWKDKEYTLYSGIQNITIPME